MESRSTSDTISGAFFVIAILASVAALVTRPFIFGPLGLVVVLIGCFPSGRYRRLSLTAALLVTVCFVIGAALAVWSSRALY